MKLAIVTAIILLSAAHAALAGDDKAADAMIAKGLELRREGRGLDALEMFQKAHTIAPSPRTFGQLGLAETAVEHWADAEEHLIASLAAAQDPWVHKNHAGLQQALTLVGQHIGQIALTGPSGAAVIISGKSAGPLPLAKAIRVNAGSALVTATSPGFKQFEMSVPVEAGKETQLKIVLEPIPLSSPPVPAVAATTVGARACGRSRAILSLLAKLDGSNPPRSRRSRHRLGHRLDRARRPSRQRFVLGQRPAGLHAGLRHPNHWHRPHRRWRRCGRGWGRSPLHSQEPHRRRLRRCWTILLRPRRTLLGDRPCSPKPTSRSSSGRFSSPSRSSSPTTRQRSGLPPTTLKPRRSTSGAMRSSGQVLTLTTGSARTCS